MSLTTSSHEMWKAKLMIVCSLMRERVRAVAGPEQVRAWKWATRPAPLDGSSLVLLPASVPPSSLSSFHAFLSAVSYPTQFPTFYVRRRL